MPATLFQDVIENGSPWLISSWGENLALGFKGSPPYIQRCFNWAVNTGVVSKGARLNWFHEAVTGKLAYVCPKSRRAIRRGVLLQLWAESRMAAAAEVRATKVSSTLATFVSETEDDGWEVRLHHWPLARAAVRQARAFMEDHIVRDSFVLDRAGGLGNVYSVGSLGLRGGSEE